MRQNPTIRKAEKTDLNAIVAIENECFAEDSFSRQQLRYLIEKSNIGCYVVVQNFEVVGYMSLLARSNAANLRLYSIAVARKAQGQHLGQMLMTFMIEKAQNLGLKRVTLEVKPSNASAIALYQKNEFEACGKKEDYYHDGSFAICMKKNL